MTDVALRMIEVAHRMTDVALRMMGSQACRLAGGECKSAHLFLGEGFAFCPPSFPYCLIDLGLQAAKIWIIEWVVCCRQRGIQALKERFCAAAHSCRVGWLSDCS